MRLLVGLDLVKRGVLLAAGLQQRSRNSRVPNVGHTFLTLSTDPARSVYATWAYICVIIKCSLMHYTFCPLTIAGGQKIKQ